MRSNPAVIAGCLAVNIDISDLLQAVNTYNYGQYLNRTETPMRGGQVSPSNVLINI